MEAIRHFRKQRGWTQEDLANAIGVKRATISKYENGTISPSLDQLKAIADALDISLTALLLYDAPLGGFLDLTELVASFNACLQVVLDNPETPSSLKLFIEQNRPDEFRIQQTLTAIAANEKIAKMQFDDETSTIETKLLLAFNKLNIKGQEVAVDRVEELGQIPAYQRRLLTDK